MCIPYVIIPHHFAAPLPSPPPSPNDTDSVPEVMLGQTVALNLSSFIAQSTVQWWYNGTRLVISPGSSKYTVSPSVFTLTIEDVRSEDLGIYQAEITAPGSSVPEFRNFLIKCEYILNC